MSWTELVRKKVMRSGSPLSHHSLNQRNIKAEAEGVRNLFPLSKKIQKALETRFRVENERNFSLERGKEYLEEGRPLTPEYKSFLKRHGVKVG